MRVWPTQVPGSIESTSYREMREELPQNKGVRISKVTDPTLTAFLPAGDKVNGTAVIICPGGGYSRLAIDLEGFDVARWFNTLGVTAFVLKYRLPHDSIMLDKSIGPLQDAQEAIRIVRRKAAAWALNPAKIGIIGFSAGGHLAATASTHFSETVYPLTDSVSARPDFSILVYPVISMKSGFTHRGSRQSLLGENPEALQIERFSNELQVTTNIPPTFLVHAFDDKAVPIENSINYYLALKKQGIASELHIYQRGGHGFGLAKKSQGSESAWTESLKTWLRDLGFIE